MNKAKRRKLEAEAARGASASSSAPLGWSTDYLILALVVGGILGGILGFTLGRREARPLVVPSTVTAPPASGADSFGRSPGHEHYGHDHP